MTSGFRVSFCTQPEQTPIWYYHQLYLSVFSLSVALFFREAAAAATVRVTGIDSQIWKIALLVIVPLAMFEIFVAFYAIFFGLHKTSNVWIVSLADNIFSILNVVFIIYIISNYNKRKLLLYLYIIVLIISVMQLGNRSTLIKFLLMYIFVFIAYENFRFHTIKALIILIFATAILPFTKDIQSIDLNSNFLQSIFYREFKTSGRILSYYFESIDHIDRGWANFFTDFVNRASFGLVFEPSQTQRQLQEIINDTTEVGLGYSMIVSIIASFEMPGLILVAILNGWIICYLYRSRKDSLTKLFLFTYFYVILCTSIRFSYASCLATIFKGLLVLLLLKILGSLGARPRRVLKPG